MLLLMLSVKSTEITDGEKEFMAQSRNENPRVKWTQL